MRRAANFFKLDSSESDTDEERKKSSKVRVEKSVVNTDAAKRETGKRKRVDDIDLGAEENTRDESNKKKKLTSVDSEVEDNSLSSKRRKKKEPSERPEAEGNNNNDCAKDKEAEGNELKSKKDPKKKRKKKQSEDSEAEGNDLNSTENAEKNQSEVSEAEGNGLNSKKAPKKKQSEDPEAEGADLNFTENAEKKQSENSEAEGNGLNSTEISKKKRKKTKKQSEDPEAEENIKGSTEDAKKIQSEDSEAAGNDLNSTEIAKKKRKKKKQSEGPEVEENNNDGAEDAEKNQSEDSEAEGNGLNSTEIAKKKRKKKKKQSEDPEVEENNGKKKKMKQKGSKSDEVVTTPSSKSAKKVKFSDQVEVFPSEDEESEEDGEEDEEEEVGVVRGKRFTKEEDELIKKSVLAYVENHALGDEGVNMILDCKSRKEVRGCWKEISTALPWRPYTSVYHRAHTIFEQGSKGVWSKEDFDLVIKYHKKYGNDWRTLADAMGKSRKHVKDAWRRIRLASKKNGHWSMEEYQNLFDLVNKDLRMKAFQEKRAKHGMLRDNIPWMAISDQIRTRDHVICCQKWYDQLTSPMVKKGIWANVDDYRLLDKLTSLDAACVDDVDWDDLLDNRDGDACRSRWNQMVHHIGIPGTKTFAEQVEILSQRYCPDIAEDREDFDNRPFDPEDED